MLLSKNTLPRNARSPTRAEPLQGLNYRAWTLCVTLFEITLGLRGLEKSAPGVKKKRKRKKIALLQSFFSSLTPSLSPTVRVSLLKHLPPGTCMGDENIPQSPALLLPFCKGTHHVGWYRSLGRGAGSCTGLVSSRTKFHKH